MTWKCTLTVSPALKRGTARSWARSMDSMMVVIGGWPGGPTRNGSESPARAGISAETDAVQRPVDEEDLADEVRPRHGAPDAGVAGLRPVVAHEEVLPLRHRPGARRLVVAPARLDVRLLELDVVDVDDSVALADLVAGEADQPLDEDLVRTRRSADRLVAGRL